METQPGNLRDLPINQKAGRIIEHEISYGGKGPIDAFESTVEVICRRFTKYPESASKMREPVNGVSATRRAIDIIEQALSPHIIQSVAQRVKNRGTNKEWISAEMTLREIENVLFSHAKHIVVAAIKNPIWHGEYIIMMKVSVEEIRIDEIRPNVKHGGLRT